MPISRRRRRRARPGPGSSRSGSAALSINRPRKRTNYWYLAASLVIAILVIGGFVIGDFGFGQGANAARGGSSDEYVESVGVAHDEMPTRRHVPEPQTVAYSTVPPTSGDHWDQWARCGFYEHMVPDERITHNMEHGNIIVSYNLPNEADVEELRGAMDNIGLAPFWGVIRAYDKIPEGTVALTTWGVSDTMDGIDGDRIGTFFETYSGTLSPEYPGGLPCSQTGIMERPNVETGS